MDLKERHAARGRRHPWETARARHFLGVLRGSNARRVLDVGAGDGFFAQALAERSGASVVCFDTNYTDGHLAELAASEPRLRFVRAEPDESFDLILLLDVVEHVADPHALVRSLVARRLAPGGQVLVSVPAWGNLYTRHDVALGHYRRYTPRGLRALLEDAGLALVAAGDLFHSLLAVRAAEKLGELARGLRSRPHQAGFGEADEKIGVSDWRAPAPVTAAIEACLAVDARIGGALQRGGWRLPGLSTWALCRRS
jgi:SAM-dependent methyltransferase